MKTKISRFSRSVLSVILAMTLIMSTMLIGTLSVNAEASITIYAIPSSYSDLSSYVESDGSINSNYILRARVQEGGQGEGLNEWRSFQFSLVDGKTIGGKKVYSATITTLYSGVNSILYQVVTSDKLNDAYDVEASYKVFQETWTNDSTYSNKLWDGSSWVDPSTKYDSSSGSTDEVTEWYMTCWYSPYAMSWEISDDRKISGSEGSINFKADSTNTCYFRMVAKLSDGTYYTYKSTKNTSFAAGDSQTLTKDTKVTNTSSTNVGTQLQFNNPSSSKPYKTFAITKNTTGEYVLTITESATAPTEPVSTYTVTYGKVGSGTVTAKNVDTSIGDSPATVDANTTVTFTAKANPGYQFDGWYSDEACSDSNKLSDTSPYTPTITANTTVYAKFTEISTTDYYVVGNDKFTKLAGIGSDKAWENGRVDSSKMDLSNGVYTKSFTNNTFETLEVAFKVTNTNGTDWYPKDNQSAKVPAGATLTVTYEPNNSNNVSSTVTGITTTYEVVKGIAQDAISMTETSSGSGIFVSSGTINNGDYFTIRKTYGSEVTYAAHSSNYNFSNSSLKPEVYNWTTSYSHNTNIYINNLNSAQYVYYDSINDQIYLQSTGSGSSGGGTLPDQYFLISNADNPSNWTESMFHQANKDSDGKYYITITPKEIADLAGAYNSNVYFTMASAKSVNNIYFQDTNSPHATTTDSSLISVEDKNNSGKKFCRFSIKSDSVISVTISYDNNNTFRVIPESSKIDNSVEVIAKDATIRTNGLQSTLPEYGDTYFYTVGSDGSNTYYTEGKTLIENKMSFTRESQKSVAAVSLDEVKKGTTLHIETQNVKDGYYVAGYVVNGETLALFNSNETPALDYTIPYDTEANTKIEITPVYFATDSSTCVTFYVEGFDSTVQNTWGNTIACYPYYSGAKDSENAFSCYPGQPMLYKDGKYFIQVPRTFGGNKVVGMTLNNYIWDDVHKTICNKSNAQTYDYDDFVRIADKMEDGKYIADNIIFSFKFRTKYNNFDYEKVSPKTISYDEFAGVATGNGWENLTDHNGNLVNIFGTQLFKTTDPQYSAKSKIEDNPTGNKHLLIVSNGYDENYQGYYATEWTIYAYNDSDSNYTKVAQIPSSALVLSYDEIKNAPLDTTIYNNQLNSYTEAYKTLENYSELPAYITYEQNDKKSYNNDGHGGNEGYRCDGRWYYSRINDEISSNVKIQYADYLEGTFTDDQFEPDSNVGTTTQAKAYFTNSTAYEKTTCEGKIGQGKFDITTTYNGSEYMFVGWYLEKEGVTTKITNSTNASIEMTGSETYVARYVKVPNGSINISHSLFSNVSETAAKGAGTLGLQVTLSYNDGKNVFSKPYTYNTSDSSISTNVIMGDVQAFYNNVKISVGDSNLNTNSFSIKVSLTSIPADNTSLNNAYVENYKDSSQSYLSFNTNSEAIANNLGWTAPSLGQSMEVSIPFNKIFTDGTPITNNVEFFSEFETNPISYEITYNFTTRLYGEKQFKESGSISVGTDGLISANGTYSFTNAYIMSVAPDESNFMKTFNWEDASITQSYDSTNHKLTVTVNSKQIDRTVHATIKLSGEEDKIIETVYGGHFKDNGEFVMAPAIKASNQVFSYWRINAVNDDGTEGAFVANCYSQYFNYVGYDDYIVTAVYGQGKNTDIYDDTKTSTTVTFLEYSRNHWNDFDSAHHKHPADAPYYKENTEYDRLYADFALAFNYKGILLNETDVPGLKLGYVLDVKGDTDVNDLKSNISNHSDDSSFKINNSNNVLNYSINRTDLDNKNRVECYYGIKNTETNTSYNIKVYSYMIVDGNVTLSEPITICYNGAIKK